MPGYGQGLRGAWKLFSRGGTEPGNPRDDRPGRHEPGTNRGLHATQRPDNGGGSPIDRPILPGYIKGYVPGVRENGGQYTHSAIWTVVEQSNAGVRLIDDHQDHHVEIELAHSGQFMSVLRVGGNRPGTMR
jgi:hypothetical protein